jgi:hypothetical protein
MAEGNDKCVCQGCCCYYNACDFNMKNFDLCCRYESAYCCISNDCCLSFTADKLGCGLTGDKDKNPDEYCKIGCVCCDLGLVKPVACCKGAFASLCYYEVASCPLSEEHLNECVCACCFVQCCPTCGVCVAPPPCPALDKLRANNNDEVEALTMDRGDGDGDKKTAAKETQETAAAPVEEKKQPAVEDVDKEQDF